MLNNSWLTNLKSYLYDNLLAKFIKEEKYRVNLVNESAMDIWSVVFTHKSFDPNIGRNYEEYELLGDRFLDANFVYYLIKRYKKKVSVFGLTELKRKYMSKVFQSELSNNLGMRKYVRTGNIELSTHISEDIFEAFVGGLVEIADTQIKNGLGNLFCYNFIIYLFNPIKLDFSVTKGHPKTQIKQIFEKLGWGIPKFSDVEGDNNQIITTIYLTDSAARELERYGITIKDNIIGKASGTSKKISSKSAYENALKYIRKLGITDTWIERVRTRRDLDSKTLGPLLKQVYNKTSSAGYKDIYLYPAQTTRAGVTMQLIGVNEKGKKTVLAETENPENKNKAKIQVLEKYLNYN